MVTIHLHNVVLFAYHGIYEEERVTGNNFEVNLDVKYDDGKRIFENIGHTISYEDLYTIVKQQMLLPTPLLEKVCAAMISKIKQEYPFITEISISIYKLQPPIKDFNGRVGVTIRKSF